MYITTKYLSNNIANITKDIRSNCTYVEDPPWRNKSNRLKKIEKYNSKYFDLTGDYSYDPDGNFTSLTRSYNSDNFSYDYYSGTNRLKKVTGTTDQYTYDYNGNQSNDYINNNTGIKYDHRNLITEFTRQDLTQDPPVTDITRYKYDEAGNRTRKTIYRSNDSNPPPLPEENEDLPSGWSITKDEYYSRDASGKEIAVYQSYNLDYWNVWGTGNEGRIKSTGMKYFYLKDHLGSIRAVINQNNIIVQAQDYDPWGHIARTWDSTSADYKFTGKEHDKESSYDYFGARYYDARVGNWTTTDPLLKKRIGYSPYNYVLRNPLILIDPDGRIDVPEQYKKDYHYLYNYLKNDIEKVIMNNKNIIDAITDVTGLSKETLKDFVKFGHGPKFEITELSTNDSKQEQNGHWQSGYEKHANDGLLGPFNYKDGTIQMDKECAEVIEETLKKAMGDKKDNDVRIVRQFLKQFFTHEIGHGAADETGIKTDEEIGIKVEMRAFGKVVNYNNGVFQQGIPEKSIFDK